MFRFRYIFDIYDLEYSISIRALIRALTELNHPHPGSRLSSICELKKKSTRLSCTLMRLSHGIVLGVYRKKGVFLRP